MTEESTVYSQAIHFANRIVYLRVPLDAVSHRQRLNPFNERESNSNSITNRCAGAGGCTSPAPPPPPQTAGSWPHSMSHATMCCSVVRHSPGLD